ncbi:MAG: hypothetical protein PUB20_02245 [Clostridia bacterium]|nr:hypothetical protein [Clostridia bacterium]
MDIMDLASKGIKKITQNYGKKINKNGPAPEIPKGEPVVFSGKSFRAGFSKAEIMPDLNSGKTYWIAGHGSGHKMEGVLSPVYTSAVWLDCGGEAGMLWIGADIVGLTNVEVQQIRDKVMASGKIPEGTVINISCTHSHSGIDTLGYWGKANILGIPSCGKDPDYMNMMMEKMVNVSCEAYANRRDGKLYSGKIELKDSLQTPRDIKDKHEILYRLRFKPNDGSNEIWIMNFGGHPNSLGGGNRLLSGEYPYFMREDIREATGAEVLFGIGAIGGMDVVHLDDDNVECVKKQGKMLSEGAQRITDEHELNPEMKILRQYFYLPVGNYVLTLLAMRHVMSFNAYACPSSDTGIAMKTELTYMSIGGQKILLLPGESFVSTVYGKYYSAEESATGRGSEINPKPLVEISGDRDMIVYGISNDMTGYVVPPNDFVLHPTQPYLNSTRDRHDKKHYHETNSMGYSAQKTIADTFAGMVESFGD